MVAWLRCAVGEGIWVFVMPGPKTIRALERGLQVLDALRASPISSLHDIHRATRIPKPTLLRILHTLDRAGLVSRRLADGHYRVSAFTDVVRKRDRHDRVAEAAGPVLVRLCDKVRWPSDLFVPAGDHMEKRESTRARSPFVLPLNRDDLVGRRVGWLMTAVGRAYLAWCPEKERETILQKLRKSDNPRDRLAHEPKRFDRVLAETRVRGYATRDRSFTWAFYDGLNVVPRDDGLAAIALPLFDGKRAHGSICILWIRTAFTVKQFAAEHLTDLQDAAREIVSSLQQRAK
jgi:IclR family transcriptional regulator, mhp operon transcriptional activator